MIETVWFCLVAHHDRRLRGAGRLRSRRRHRFICSWREPEPEREQVLRSIGPVWDGNEVWLLAGGGTLYFAFPALYASAFSGFYLSLMMVLWLLILRGIAIEFRNHIESPLWQPFWDMVFGGSSALLALLFGAALGNVVRGVPLDRIRILLPAPLDRSPARPRRGHCRLVHAADGLASFVALALHAALWVVLKTSGALQERSRLFFQTWWWPLVAITIFITGVSFYIQPRLMQRFVTEPWGFIFPVLALAGIFGMRILSARERDRDAFLSSCLYLVGMLTSAAFSVFPQVLPSNLNQAQSLTVYNAAAPEYGLKIGLVWWIPGMLLAAGYSIFVYRRFSGKVTMIHA